MASDTREAGMSALPDLGRIPRVHVTARDGTSAEAYVVECREPVRVLLGSGEHETEVELAAGSHVLVHASCLARAVQLTKLNAGR